MPNIDTFLLKINKTAANHYMTFEYLYTIITHARVKHSSLLLFDTVLTTGKISWEKRCRS